MKQDTQSLEELQNDAYTQQQLIIEIDEKVKTLQKERADVSKRLRAAVSKIVTHKLKEPQS